VKLVETRADLAAARAALPGTVARHVAAIEASAPDSVPAYVALARCTADRAIAAGQLRPHDAEALLGVLASDRPERVA